MFKKCVQRVENQRVKRVQTFPQHPPYFAQTVLQKTFARTFPTEIPTPRTAKTQLLHNRVDENNRGKSRVIRSFHTAYYYYY